MKNSDFKFDDKIEYEMTIKFKLPSVNDKLIYNDNNDNNDKSKGYILKNGSYSKKLRINSLKKSRVNGG